MGRSLGYHDSDELDRPELNKCPDCECYFASDACPLCGKICPEEMRAGHRARVKPPKKRSNSTGRVQFIDWYHSWWFIILMLSFMPIVGIILFFTSPHSRKSKIIAVSVVLAVYALLFAVPFLWTWYTANMSPVNDDIPKAEYVERCEPISAEAFYRNPDPEGRYVTFEVQVLERRVDGESVEYLCTAKDGGDIRILVCDCNLEGKVNFLPGDTLRVYGESGGTVEGYRDGVFFSHPWLFMAYAEPARESAETSGSLCLFAP
jgi:hypothetical protein